MRTLLPLVFLLAPTLHGEAQPAAPTSIRVVVALRPPASPAASREALVRGVSEVQARVLSRVARSGFVRTDRWTAVPALAGDVPPEGLLQLRADPEVLAADADVPGGGNLKESVPLVRADQAQALGLTGAGVTVAILDSGVDKTQADLSDAVVDERCFCANANGTGCCPDGSVEQTGPGSARDENGHGTNVTGIVAGRGRKAGVGVAPGVSVVAVRVLDRQNRFSGTTQVVSGLDWILANHPEVKVVNMSLGTSALFPGVCDTAAAFTRVLATAIDALKARGTTVFVSSGNDSSPTMMEAPACVAASVAVGAVFDANVGPRSLFACDDFTTKADQVTCFSNASPALDLLAPGAMVTSAGLGGGTSTYAGTSQASPHAAGGAALLLSADPTLSPAQIEAALKSTGVPVTDARNGGSWPRIDLLAAVRSVVKTATPLFVPIVLDVVTGTARFTTELALTNRGAGPVDAVLAYAAQLGERKGSGSVRLTLPAGRQLVIPDVLADLRTRGLAIPPAADGQQGGTLLVTFEGATDPAHEAASARTTSATTDPVGAAGLAYAALPANGGSASTLAVFGLRSDAADRSNLAVFNPGAEPVTVKVTVVASGGASTVVRASEVLGPYGFAQINSPELLDAAGVANGYALVERVSAAGVFGAYGVINDRTTNDGSYVLPASPAPTGSWLTLPVLVETATFRSELVLANRGSSTATFSLTYVESLDAASTGPKGSAAFTLAAGEQRIVPDALGALRQLGVSIPAGGSHAGAVRVIVSGVPLDRVYAGARTAAAAPSGGQFGLFTPGLAPGEEAVTEAYLYGLRADATNRTNVAVVNAGAPGDGSVTLELVAYDGDAGGAAKGDPEVVTLAEGAWRQFDGFLSARGVANGWVRVRRTAGSAPWIAYGVVNDGAGPGQRTGDGAYVAMKR